MKMIGVMGSAANLNYSAEVEKVAIEIGEEIAKRGYILVYGAEKGLFIFVNPGGYQC